ncbi:MAG: selenocysteine-specific translation elongation factor [Cumulibacter sp.]
MTRSAVFATAGHVDHGKSALVRALTGIEPDRWDEERRRGMTLDLGFAWTTLAEQVDVAFVDVPGHERYVPTMLAGAGSVAGVLFVVAADEGWAAQSAEHLEGLRALGVRDGLLVITKSDLMDPELAEAEARERLDEAGFVGIRSVAVSALTGAGLDGLRTEMLALAHRLPEPDPEGDVRLWLDRSFSISGAGTVVTGTLTDGTLRVDDELELRGLQDAEPRQVRVRGLQTAGQERESVSGASRVAVNLRNVAPHEAPRGSQLLSPGAFLRPEVMDVRVDTPGQRLPAACVVHIGTASLQARLRPLDAQHVRLTFDVPLPVRIGDRMVLRDPGQHVVLGAAVVLDPDPPALRRRGAATQRAAALAQYSSTPDGAALLADKRLVRIDVLRTMGCTALPAAIDGWCLDPSYRKGLESQLADLVAADAQVRADSRGVSLGAAQRQLDLPSRAVLLELLTDGLTVRDGHIVGEHHAVMSPASSAAMQRFTAEVAGKPFYSPEAPRLRELGLDPSTLAVLCRHGELVDLGRGTYLTPDAIDEAVAVLSALDGAFSLGEARIALGTTRRIAVPLMEHLQRTGRTRRMDGDKHAIRPPSTEGETR